MTPKQLRQELVNAYEGHDREGFDRALDRMERILTYTGPVDNSRSHPLGLSQCTRTDREGCECVSDVQRLMCMHRRAG